MTKQKKATVTADLIGEIIKTSGDLTEAVNQQEAVGSTHPVDQLKLLLSALTTRLFVVVNDRNPTDLENDRMGF